MLTVGNDAVRVERMLEEGGLSCPGCGGRLAGWGHGRLRVVFGSGRRTRRVVRPRRSRCTACRVTHMLLPAAMLARRADEARVIGAAVTAAARGRGRRRIAAELGVPEETVRRWLRRFAARADRVREIFTGVAAAVSADPVPRAGRVGGGRCGRGGGRGGRGDRRPLAAAARGVAVGDSLRGHQRDLAGPGDHRPGGQHELGSGDLTSHLSLSTGPYPRALPRKDRR